MSSDDEQDLATVEVLRARGPMWIPAGEAEARMDQIEAAIDIQAADDTDEAEDTEDSEDAAAAAEWDALKASGKAITVSHEEVRRRLGLD